MFIDEARIRVKAGDGGHGCVSFRREKFMPKGGPDGGDGGRGGNIIFVVDDSLDTLTDFAGKHDWVARNGGCGEGSNRHGADGEDLIIPVPPGTLIIDEKIGLVIKDMNKIGMEVTVCRGGRGGEGNKAFASSVRQVPRFATDGKPGQERHLRLELKLIADVGLVGKPNAGKSTLVSRASAARPKIANYPFTTLTPVLGIVELSDYRRFVMADIPGLIEGAHEGLGLGHEFLKHIERTRILLHILDIMPSDNTDPVDNYHTIHRELKLHSEVLGQKPEIVVLNKSDLDQEGIFIEDIKSRLPEHIKDVFVISAVTGQGIDELNEHLWAVVRDKLPEEEIF